MQTATAAVGDLLRAWRTKRRLSQMEVALRAGVSPRHLSFVETGRSRPGAASLLAIAEVLAVPLRERNALLLAAGYAPRYSQTALDAPDADMAQVRRSLQRVLDAHDPYPGIALDRGWNLVLSNAAARRLVALLPPALSQPVPNIFRLALHPQGMAAFTVNFAEWGRHMLLELRRLADASTEPALAALLDEVSAYPNVQALAPPSAPCATAMPLLLPCVFELGGQRLALFTTLATIGTPRDVTLAELTLELFYPADAATEAALRVPVNA
jgi:transcriptional regulator with XRE-family HTH domain